jgi:two-component sensor histidine kinase
VRGATHLSGDEPSLFCAGTFRRIKSVSLAKENHRVKNNLVVISSQLNMQARRSGETNVQNSLTESRARIRAKALIHETLYQSGDLSAVRFEEYVRKLVWLPAQALSVQGTAGRHRDCPV